MAFAALCIAGCGGRGPDTGNAPAPIGTMSGTFPLDGIFQLEMSGAPPADTVVTFIAGERRVIVLRHGPPDNAVFAEIQFDTTSFGTRGARVDLTVRPRPGVYGVTIETTTPFTAATLTFKYAVHFLDPTGARARYGSDIGYERALGIARLDGASVTFMPSTRPALDNLAAQVTQAGTYLVGAPR